MKILVLDQQLLNQVISKFPTEYLISKVSSPFITYRYQIENDYVEIKCLNGMEENEFTGIFPDLIYCTHAEYRKSLLQINAVAFCNPNLEVRLVQIKI